MKSRMIGMLLLAVAAVGCGDDATDNQAREVVVEPIPPCGGDAGTAPKPECVNGYRILGPCVLNPGGEICTCSIAAGDEADHTCATLRASDVVCSPGA